MTTTEVSTDEATTKTINTMEKTTETFIDDSTTKKIIIEDTTIETTTDDQATLSDPSNPSPEVINSVKYEDAIVSNYHLVFI